jgi:CRP/FNR family transcriptional regulator, cyclic AMP receptor protein
MVSAVQSCVTCPVRGPHCFCSLSPSTVQQLQGIGSHARFGPGEIVLREDATADRVYVVCRGKIKLTASSADGRLLIVRIAGPGDVLGLASLLNGVRHKVTAETLEVCDMKTIARADFLEFMENFREVGRSAAVTVAWEYEGMLLTARRLATSSSAAGKLATALLDWGRMGAAEDEPAAVKLEFRMPLTHEELGSMTGLSRETVTRLLGKFRREGLVEMDGERMVLCAPAKMESLYC